MSADPARLATVELLGALAYGQLRATTTAVALVALAPDVERAELLLGFGEREQQRYHELRARLDELTDLPEPVLERQRPAFDRYFDALPLDEWLGGVVFLAVGLPMAADFARAIAPTVDERSSEVLLATLAGRHRTEAFAHEELARLRAEDDATDARARRLVADVVGAALTSFTGALGETDALKVLFEHQGEAEGVRGETVVKRMAIQVLESHRRRMLELGLDDLE